MRNTSQTSTQQNLSNVVGGQNNNSQQQHQQLQVKQSQSMTAIEHQRSQQNSGSDGEENRVAGTRVTAASSMAQTQAQSVQYVQDQTMIGGASDGIHTMVPQTTQQPLQARSSNSGTSVKRSDNISQSSYPNGDISSDKPGHGQAKTSSTSTQQQLTIGQTTSAFAASQQQPLGGRGRVASYSNNGGTETVVGTPTSTANTKEASSMNKRVSTSTRRSATSVSMNNNNNQLLQQQETHSTAASQKALGGQNEREASERANGTQPTSRVSTRASGRQTRQSDHRAVKDSSSSFQQHHQQLTQSAGDAQFVVGGGLAPPANTTTKPTTMQQSATAAQSLNTSSVDLLMLEEQAHTNANHLKPVKQSCSENNNSSYAVNNAAPNNNAGGATGTTAGHLASSYMRTTRSKAKASKQVDKTAKSSPNKTDETTPNGQPDMKSSLHHQLTTANQQASPQAKFVEADTGVSMPAPDNEPPHSSHHPPHPRAQSDLSCIVDEPMLMISGANDETQQMMVIDKTTLAAPATTSAAQQASQSQASAWQLAIIAAVEESKLQSSPKSTSAAAAALNTSTLIAAVQGEKTANNQSFRINDSTDSLLENPLTTVIKQFQNLRTNAQLTGKNKPTIQQFLEKFEKEMQQLEDQYQAQQQAREEQMRLFEQHYGGKKQPTSSGDLSCPKATKALAFGSAASYMAAPSTILGNNDQHGSGRSFTATPVTAMMAGGAGNQSSCGDALMVQDTATLGPMPSSSPGAASFNHNVNNVAAADQINTSFNSAVHGPQAQSVFGGASCSEVTHSEVYESFSFSQNSMLQFYPRQVRKILTRRKTTNSASTITGELRDLKAPKHKFKMKKTMSKMQSLALCQMNMMQILLQKISRRSKVIRKQEKLVNDNLKRKRIYLEKDRFDLMSVLRKSLEVTEQREQQLQSQQQQANNSVANGNSAGAASSIQHQLSYQAQQNQQQQQQVAQKIKTQRGHGSELNSNCLSASGAARYGAGPTKNTTINAATTNLNICSQSIKGSSTAAPGPFGEENTSMDGGSRKQTRLQSGAEHCLSVTADPVSYKGVHSNIIVEGGSVKAQQATPEPPSKKIASNSSQTAPQQAVTNAANQNQNHGSNALANNTMSDAALMVVLDGGEQLHQLAPQQQSQYNEVDLHHFAQSNTDQDLLIAGPTHHDAAEMATIKGHLAFICAQQQYSRLSDTSSQQQKQQKVQHQQSKKQQQQVDQNMVIELVDADHEDDQEDQDDLVQGIMIDQQKHDSQRRRRGTAAVKGASKASSSRLGAGAAKQLSPLRNNIELDQQDSSHQQQPNATNGVVSQSSVASAVSASVHHHHHHQEHQSQQFVVGAADHHHKGVGENNHHHHTHHLHPSGPHHEDPEVDFFAAAASGLQHHSVHQLPLNMVVVGNHHHHHQMHHHHHLDEEVEDQVMQPSDHHHHHFIGSAAEVTGHHHHHQVVHRQSTFPTDFIMKHHHHSGSSRDSGSNSHPQSQVVGAGGPSAVGNSEGGHHHPQQHHHFQPLVAPGQLAELAMHHSKSVVLPPAPSNQHRHNDILDTLVDFAQVDFVDDNVASAGPHQPEGPGEASDAAARRGVRTTVTGGKPSTMPNVHHHHHHGVVVDHNPHHHHHHDDNFHDMADFFGESAQELSSIDHSAAAIDAYGYNNLQHHHSNHQAGPNPYEQAKRQYLKKQQQQHQQAHQQVVGSGVGENNGQAQVVGVGVEAQSPPSPSSKQFKVNDHHHHQHHDAGHPHHFVSPMVAVVGLHNHQQLSSADQHTPQPKVVVGAPNAHEHHAPTSHFTTAMSGVMNVDHQAGLGRGSTLVASSQPHQEIAAQSSSRRLTTAGGQHHHHHQLSVSRICAGSNAALQVGGASAGGGPDPFNMSANRGGLPAQTNAFGNTPAGLMSNGQPCLTTDAHRQHLSVSGWNLVDETDAAASVHHHHHHQHHHQHIHHQPQSGLGRKKQEFRFYM